MQIKAIAFDWNGTVMDDWELMFEVVRRHVELGLGKPPSVREFISNFAPPYMDYIRNYGSIIPPTLNWEVWDEVISEFGDVHIQAGVPALVERFVRRQIPTYVITANKRSAVEDGLVKQGLRTLFNGLYADSEWKHADIQKILNDHAIDPREMMYVGDMRIDMQAAKKTGVVGIGIGSAKGHEDEHCRILLEAGATHVFPSISLFHDALIRGL